jgi:hypothetical protein
MKKREVKKMRRWEDGKKSGSRASPLTINN